MSKVNLDAPSSATTSRASSEGFFSEHKKPILIGLAVVLLLSGAFFAHRAISSDPAMEQGGAGPEQPEPAPAAAAAPSGDRNLEIRQDPTVNNKGGPRGNPGYKPPN